MTTTAADLITLTSQQLHGWGAARDRVTSLAADIAPGDTTFTVAYTSGQSVGITPGIVEIDSEQLYVVNVDQASGTCTLASGFGRGYNRTTAAAHTAGTVVTSRPSFPRAELLRELNNVIGSLYPDLFAVSTYSTTVTYPSNSYTLPGSPQQAMVLDAQWQDPIGNWQACRSYQLDRYDQSFRLSGSVPVGRPLRILYASEPTRFTAETDNYSITGLPDTCQDLLVLGAAARQIAALDMARVQTKAAEQSDRSKVVPPFAGEQAGKYAMAEFLQRLQNEANSLRKRYGSRLVRTW